MTARFLSDDVPGAMQTFAPSALVAAIKETLKEREVSAGSYAFMQPLHKEHIENRITSAGVTKAHTDARQGLR